MSTDDFGKYMESLVGGSVVPDFSHFLTDSLHEDEEKKVVQSRKGEEPQEGSRAKENLRDSKVPVEEIAKKSPEKTAAVGVVLLFGKGMWRLTLEEGRVCEVDSPPR